MNSDKKFTEEFINMYQLYPCLWNSKCKEYSDKHLRSDAYNDLIEKCRERYPDANKDFVVKKINALKSSFRREHKKVVDSKKTGSSAEESYEPNLWYYDILSFVIDSETPRSGKSNLDDETSVNEDPEVS